MKNTTAFILVFISLSVFGQRKSFDSLEQISFDNSASARFNPDITEVFNTVVSELSEADPFFCNEGEGSYSVKLLKTKISAKYNTEYFVEFSPGPSADPSFFFYKPDNLEKPEFSIEGLHLVLPGNGSIYISGHANNYYNTRKKFQIISGEPIEVEQPFYYVGLDTKTLESINLYESTRLEKVIAQIPAEYEIEVLLNKKGTTLFLIKSSFGLVGWVDVGYIGQQPKVIENLFFFGD